jgi:hypothetical protein
MEMVGELLRDAAAGTDVGRVAEAFDHVEVPASLAHAFGLEPEDDHGSVEPVEVPGGRVVVLAGPGVVASGNIDGLRAIAAGGNLPIANTWGAKGVLPWDSPHHMGTCGLQARDFELLGFADYDAIVATGIDPRESAPEQFSLAPVIDIPPGDLGRLAEETARSAEPIAANELYERLSAIAQPGFTDDRVPLHPARAVGDLRAVLPPGGVVTADPGLAGLWVARTFPTTEPGTVVVPALATPGIAATLALVSALRGLPAVAATTEPLDHTTLAVLELATELAAAFVLDVWGPGGSIRRADDHLELLQAASREPGVSIVDAPVDRSLTRKLVDAAGPVVAWGGGAGGE